MQASSSKSGKEVEINEKENGRYGQGERIAEYNHLDCPMKRHCRKNPYNTKSTYTEAGKNHWNPAVTDSS